MSKINRLPLQEVGLSHLVAIPYLLTLSEPLHTILRLGLKQVEILPVQHALSNTYTINGVTATGYEFMYGDRFAQAVSQAINKVRHALEIDGEGTMKAIYKPDSPPSSPANSPPPASRSSHTVSLESPEQYAMAWPKYQGVYDRALPYLPAFVSWFNDIDEATKQFWPTIANFQFGNNLVVLEKIRESLVEKVKSLFGDTWTAEGMEDVYKQGRLYALDMTVFECLSKPAENPNGRYTHSTFTVLRQDPATKALEPIAIWVSGKNFDGKPRIYTRANATPGAWLYALHAVKVSMTVYAIFLRHVYLWHVIPAAMQMTMHNVMDTKHPIYQLLAPQSKYTIGYNQVMLLLWAATPASSIVSSFEFLRLSDEFAKGRSYYDDDPKVALEKLGIREEDFTVDKPWDQYAAQKDVLELWDATERYADACVDAMYADDAAVAKDAGLQGWLAASGDPDQANIRGIGAIDSKAALKRMLTSLLFRIVAHGGTNMGFATFLVHLFSPNFPICLQRRDIPEPNTQLDTKQLLTYLPNTQTLGFISSSFFQFGFTNPYEPFIPREGVEAKLYFPGGTKDPRNRALVDYRKALIAFIEPRAVLPDQIHHWPLNVET